MQLAWQTYAAFCRKFGEHKTQAVPDGRCWNDELLQPARDQLILNWVTLENWLHWQETSMVRDARTIFNRWREEIGGRSLLSGKKSFVVQALLQWYAHFLAFYSAYLSCTICPRKPLPNYGMEKKMHTRTYFEFFAENDANFRVQISVQVSSKWCANSLIRNTKRDMAHGHASSYISGLMQAAYTRINLEAG